MPKVKIYTFLCLYFIYAVFNILTTGGCSAQSVQSEGPESINDTAGNPSKPELSEQTKPSDAEEAETAKITNPNFDFGIDIDPEYGIMEILVFDTGKADAILITTENHAVMIDTGETKHGYEIADYLLSRDITAIDYLVITHFHKDHVGGASELINNLTVKETIMPNYLKESKQYERFINAMITSGLDRTVLKETLKFTLDNIEFTLYPSRQGYYEFRQTYETGNENEEDNAEDNGEDEAGDIDIIDINDITVKENDFSIVISVKHGNNNFLFTGDAMSERLGELLSTEEIADTDFSFLKIPHHGRYNKRSEEFIYTIRPEYAVITCSSDNPADKRIIASLKDIDAGIYLTQNGDVYCISNGKAITIMYKKP